MTLSLYKRISVPLYTELAISMLYATYGNASDKEYNRAPLSGWSQQSDFDGFHIAVAYNV